MQRRSMVGAIQRILKKAPVRYGLLAVVLLLVCLIGFEIGIWTVGRLKTEK